MDESSSTAALLLLKMPTGVIHVTGNIITHDIPTANSPIARVPHLQLTNIPPKIFGLI